MPPALATQSQNQYVLTSHAFGGRSYPCVGGDKLELLVLMALPEVLFGWVGGGVNLDIYLSTCIPVHHEQSHQHILNRSYLFLYFFLLPTCVWHLGSEFRINWEQITLSGYLEVVCIWKSKIENWKAKTENSHFCK